jgi:hypothetical protein
MMLWTKDQERTQDEERTKDEELRTKDQSVLVRQTPARRPVLHLQSLAPAERSAAIAEVATSQRAVVDKPDDGRSVRSRSNQGVARLVRPPHSPHDGRLVVYEWC